MRSGQGEDARGGPAAVDWKPAVSLGLARAQVIAHDRGATPRGDAWSAAGRSSDSRAGELTAVATDSHLLSAASRAYRHVSAHPVLMAEVVPTYRCGGSPGFTPDSLFASDLDDWTTSYRTTISSELHGCRAPDVVSLAHNLWIRRCVGCGQPAPLVDADRSGLWTTEG